MNARAGCPLPCERKVRFPPHPAPTYSGRIAGATIRISPSVASTSDETGRDQQLKSRAITSDARIRGSVGAH